MTTALPSLRKAAANAPKYVLLIEGAGYLASTQGLSGINFTPYLELAMQYSIGFDNPKIKLGIWNAAAKKMFNNSGVKFEAVEAAGCPDKLNNC